ncbi:MAG: class I SAM-dependent methyltransferase [Armatimonadetes bacterium]|nr:class I SAM-dependent methyltransferase [Armatimonadota bacterium]
MASNDWNADRYVKNAAFVSEYGSAVAELLGNIYGKRVLDLGCGDGRLTSELVNKGASVIGIDASDSMIESARDKGLEAYVLDALQMDYEAEFDSVFTNATLHWIPDHPSLTAKVFRALKPGGEFVGEFGGHGNVAAISTAVRATLTKHGYSWVGKKPVTYSSVKKFDEVLRGAGFDVPYIQLIPRPTPLPTGVRGWLETFGKPFMEDADSETQAKMIDDIEELLAPALRDEYGNWTADYIRLRFRATKGA